MTQAQEEARTLTLTERLGQRLPAIVRGFVLLVFIVHPLFVTPSTYYSIVDDKRVFFTVIFCLLMVLTVIGCPALPKGRALLHRIRPYEYAMLGYWLVIVLSTCFSEDPLCALLGSNVNNEGLLMQTAYLLTAVVVGRLYKPKEIDLLVLCLAAVAVSVIGILQVFQMDIFGLNPPTLQDTNWGPGAIMISTMSNRNILSTYTCLAFCLAVGLFAKSRAKWRFAYLPIAWVLFAMILIGVSESGYIGLMAALLVMMSVFLCERYSAAKLCLAVGSSMPLAWVVDRAYLAREWSYAHTELVTLLLILGGVLLVLAVVFCFVPGKNASGRKITLTWYIVLSILLVIVLAVLPIAAEKTGHQTLNQAVQVLNGSLDDDFGSNRFFVWRRALTLIPESPLIGHGPDQFYPQFSERYGDEASERYGVYFDKAHNEYVQFAVDAGLLGLGCMLAFYLLVIVRSLRYVHQPMPAAALLAMLCFLVQAFFNFSTPLAHPVIWCMWGVLAALACPPTEPNDKCNHEAVSASTKSDS